MSQTGRSSAVHEWGAKQCGGSSVITPVTDHACDCDTWRSPCWPGDPGRQLSGEEGVEPEGGLFSAFHQSSFLYQLISWGSESDFF